MIIYHTTIFIFCISSLIITTSFLVISFVQSSSGLGPTEILNMEHSQQQLELETCLINAGINPDNIVQRPTEISSTTAEKAKSTESSLSYTYSYLNTQCYLQGGQIKPLAYIIPESITNIQAIIKCCVKFNIHFVPKSGGHSFNKYSYGDSNTVIIDLKKLNHVQVNSAKKIVNIGPGTIQAKIWYELWKQTNNNQFTIPLGIYTTVGISGLALGGGYGHLARLYGLTLDNIIELELINYQGKIIKANNQVNQELFWALRGAGANSYGIVTNFRFKLSPTPKNVIYAVRVYDFDVFPQFYKAWQQLFGNNNNGINRLSNAINSFVRIAGRVIKMDLFDFQLEKLPDNSEEMALINNILKKFPGTFNETSSFIKSMAYEEYLIQNVQSQGFTVSTMADFDKIITNQLCNNNGTKYSYKVKSLYVYKQLDSNTIWKLYQLLEQIKQHVDLFIEPYGGAINNIGRNDTAFIHRGQDLLYCMQIYITASNLTSFPEEKVKALKYFYDESKVLLEHKESYQNYVDGDLTAAVGEVESKMDSYLERYYGGRLTIERLVQIKREFDPFDLFHYPQSIPLDLSGSGM